MALTLLIADSASEARAAAARDLPEVFKIIQAESGMAALGVLEQTKPDILLLNIDMHDIDGYEVCRVFKEQAPQCHTILLSNQESRAAYIAAYDAGADDFIPQSLHHDELSKKLLALARSLSETQQLQQSVRSATDTALQAITSSAELGTVINFFKKANSSNDNATLLNALVQTAANYRLTVAAQLHYKDEILTINSDGKSNPLEAHMLQTLAQDNQKIFSMARRLVINFPRITLQIKDMPIDDPERCGRLRDHIAILVEAAENRFDGIMNEQQIRAQQALTLNAIGLIQQSIQKLEVEYRTQAGSSMRLFTELQDKFEHTMVYLGLTDNQENALISMIAQSLNEASRIYEQGLSLDDEFSHVIATLLHLTQQSPTAATEAAHAEVMGDDDITLF